MSSQRKVERAYTADAFIDAAPEGIAILHLDGSVLRVNSEFSRIFGFSQNELAGIYLEATVPTDKMAEAVDFHRAELQGARAAATARWSDC